MAVSGLSRIKPCMASNSSVQELVCIARASWKNTH